MSTALTEKNFSPRSPRQQQNVVQSRSPSQSPRRDVKNWMRGTASYRTSYGVDLPYRAWTTPDVIFSVIDVDGSGQLSIDELRKFFKKSPLDPAKMETMFTLMDVDGSGEISREEWRAGFHAAGFDGSGVVGQSAEGFDTLLALVKPNYAVTQLLGDLHGGRAPNLVTRPEYRGVTLHQLRQLWKHVNKRCVKEGACRESEREAIRDGDGRAAPLGRQTRPGALRSAGP